MKRYISFLNKSVSKAVQIIKYDGFVPFLTRVGRYIYYKKRPEEKKRHVKDILFINGCTLPHPERYRVHHQMEQLTAAGMTSDSVFYENITLDDLKYYRGFVFFRCPVTDVIREFIQLAKSFNKTCFFDIDDLVIDTTYTNQIPYVAAMNPDDKSHYDDGVGRMKETMQLCDYGITTTEQLQCELQKYIKEVFINRNVASDEMVYLANRATKEIKRDPSRIVIGYFSGSITHNVDFEIVLQPLLRLLEENENIYIKIAGILDVPTRLKKFERRIIRTEFMDWRLMTREVAACDIVVAPVEDTIFNRAKSENKWLEASLVGVPILASNIGAFKGSIEHNVTGVLVENTESGWYEALTRLVENKNLRISIGNAARKQTTKYNTTVSRAVSLAEYIQNKLSRNIAFVLPSTDISGGVNVVLKHADILRRHGWDVSLIDSIHRKTLKKSLKEYDYRMNLPGYNVITYCRAEVKASFDTMVATLWNTLEYIKKYPNVKNRSYFVQNYEADFLEHGAGVPRFLANGTYYDQTGVHYITMSLWCKKWLKEQFGKEARYASNGIDLDHYPMRERDFSSKKIKLLIEGDSRSEYKNTDEAFRIVSKLDPNRFEISYLSYRREPKSWYRVDKYYNRIAPEKVGEVYASCDILLKTSLLESFSYPPLEMMATGGVSVVLPNGGNVEYLEDEKNCLFYESGNIDDAIEKIERIIYDKNIRLKLIKGGLKTAKSYTWESLEDSIVKLYEISD